MKINKIFLGTNGPFIYLLNCLENLTHALFIFMHFKDKLLILIQSYLHRGRIERVFILAFQRERWYSAVKSETVLSFHSESAPEKRKSSKTD